MKIIIDNRETSLYDKIENLKINHYLEKKNLLLGDIHILDDKDNLQIIIERKTIKDLLASLNDGRYNEQAFRLNDCDLDNHKICYMLEGKIHYDDKNVVFGCMSSIVFNKKFSLLTTASIDDTACLITKIATKLIIHSDNNSNTNSNKKYEDVVNISKKSKVTPENIDVILLSNIPSVSNNSAKLIVSKFKSIKRLIEEISKNENALADITYINAKNQTKKLTKPCITNIYKYLLK